MRWRQSKWLNTHTYSWHEIFANIPHNNQFSMQIANLLHCEMSKNLLIDTRIACACHNNMFWNHFTTLAELNMCRIICTFSITDNIKYDFNKWAKWCGCLMFTKEWAAIYITAHLLESIQFDYLNDSISQMKINKQQMRSANYNWLHWIRISNIHFDIFNQMQ